MITTRVCEYCNKPFEYNDLGRKKPHAGRFCCVACYDNYQRVISVSKVPSIDYLKSMLLSSPNNTVTLSELSKLTGVTKTMIRKSFSQSYSNYVEFHKDVKGEYTPDHSSKKSIEHKSITTRLKHCEYCGEPFEGHFNSKFCSMQCKDTFDYRKVIGNTDCYVCGSPVEIVRGRKNSIAVCSDTCRATLLNRGMQAQKLFDMLESLGVKGVREYTERGLVNDRTGSMLKVDFFSSEFNLAVEYHGEQHYLSKPYFDKQESLADRQYRDSVKKAYLESKGVNVVIWKYTVPVTMENVLQVFTEYLHYDNTEVI